MINSNFLKCLCLCVLILASYSLSAQEICDNGIDDDNNGLIDLNDPACVCSDLVASSLIPNPSFEDMTCCPETEAQLECAVGWIQASTPTTDYVHTCGILGNLFLGFEAPLPFPDGDGAIGFRDGRPGMPGFKEYAGSCLTQTMTVGTEYRLDFFVGFHDAPGSTEFDMAIFGATQCSSLPFGGGDNSFGCPTNGPGWVQLGAMTVTGTNEWRNVVFDFVADQAYEAIVLGPACADNPNVNNNPYFFFDRLVLAESIMFEVPLADISGDICNNDLVLTSSDGMGGTFQWYQDGVALEGETGQTLSLMNVPGVEGTYEVVVTTDTGCFSGEAFELSVPSYAETIEENFCEGGSIIVGGQEFDSAGTFELELIASDGCDSLVTLILTSTETMTGTVAVEACEGDSITVNNETYTIPGVYTQNLTSVDGCDSILTVQFTQLNVSSSQLSFEACDGEEIVVNGVSYTMSGQFTQQFVNTVGCDSILNISIVSGAATTGNVSFAICEGTGIDVNGQNFTQAGIFTQELTGVTGCDSLLTINIIQLPTSSEQIQASICEGEEIVINGQSYNQAGTFMQGLTNTVGCDSILDITIEVLNGASSSLTFGVCDTESISINGEVFSDAGTFTQVLTASSGCDSILTIQIESNDVCSDCIFFEEFTAGSVILTRLDEQNYAVGIVQHDELKLNMDLSHDAFTQFVALYLVDNEAQQQGNTSTIQQLVEGKVLIQEVLSTCAWDTKKRFSIGEISKSMPYSSDDLPENMNVKKLDYLYKSLLEQSSGLPIGGQMKINLR